jgi:hypothetical protein
LPQSCTQSLVPSLAVTNGDREAEAWAGPVAAIVAPTPAKPAASKNLLRFMGLLRIPLR